MTQNDNTAAARRKSASQPSWHPRQAGPPVRHFPQIEKIYDGGARDVLMRGIEATCRSLVEQTQSGQKREQDRARAALAAYGRTLELLRELEDLRGSMAEPASSK